MVVKEINEKEIWEGFLRQCEEKTFLHSWNWGQFQKIQANKIWRLGVYVENEVLGDAEGLIGIALVVRFKAKRGTFLFVPHGPVILKQKKEALVAMVEEIKKIANEEYASFIRISPFWQKTEENEKLFKELGFVDAPIHMHAEVTWELNILPQQQDILAGMRKTTRYLIRQAEKNPDIQITKSENIEDLERFNPVYLETAKRHRFVVFSKKYLEDQFKAFSVGNEIMLFLGKYKEEIVSVAIFVFWQGIAFYHHSGSLTKYNKIPVSYLLQWEAIKEAQKRGCKIYNFWGIAPVFVEAKTGIFNLKFSIFKRVKKHPWEGLTAFKMGFGGYKRELVKTQDLILSKKYWVNYFIERLRKIKRGF